MGVFSKLKGIFYDEVEVPEEEEKEIDKVSKIVKSEPKEKTEVPKIEEVKYKPLPVEEEEQKEDVKKTENTFNERELFRSERTFNFVDFDNEEEEEEKPVSRRNVLSEQNRGIKVENPVMDSATDTQKAFKPTPVISPIWGVLNKDYKKDDVQDSKNMTMDNLNSAITSYDSVRRKAYGTLEDDLEDTLNTMNKLTTKEVKEEAVKEEPKKEPKKELDVDLLEQKTQKIENLISKIEEATNDLDRTMSIGELEDKAELENFEDDDKVEVEPANDKTLTDSTLEHDLFNLIDSMYDDKEE